MDRQSYTSCVDSDQAALKRTVGSGSAKLVIHFVTDRDNE